MLVQQPGVVIGVDTHKHTHTAAAVTSTGAVLDRLTVTANRRGYRQLLAFGRHHEARLWAIKGTGSFGAGLTVALLAEDERVVKLIDRSAEHAGRVQKR